MIKSFSLPNPNKPSRIMIDNLYDINVIIGENGAGKSFIINRLYDLTYLHFKNERVNANIELLFSLLKTKCMVIGSVVFIDDIEAHLHPVKIRKVIELINLLSTSHIQFFITTHSYFVLKNLHIIAQKHDKDVSLLMVDNEYNWSQFNLKNGMPSNSIGNEFINLFDMEMKLC